MNSFTLNINCREITHTDSRNLAVCDKFSGFKTKTLVLKVDAL
jgi:hypothetical protein